VGDKGEERKGKRGKRRSSLFLFLSLHTTLLARRGKEEKAQGYMKETATRGRGKGKQKTLRSSLINFRRFPPCFKGESEIPADRQRGGKGKKRGRGRGKSTGIYSTLPRLLSRLEKKIKFVFLPGEEERRGEEGGEEASCSHWANS